MQTLTNASTRHSITTTTSEQRKIAEISQAFGDFLALRDEALNAPGAHGRLADLAVRPHVTKDLLRGNRPDWARRPDDALIYARGVAANLILGFVEPTQCERKIEDPSFTSTRDLIFRLGGFSSGFSVSRTSLPEKIHQPLSLDPNAVDFAIRYRSIISHGDRPNTPPDASSFKAIFNDTLTVAHSCQELCTSQLQRIVDSLGAVNKFKSTSIFEHLDELAKTLIRSRAQFIIECSRITSDSRLMRHLRDCSAQEARTARKAEVTAHANSRSKALSIKGFN